ncbi:MAG: hypothetical protein RLZZ393_915, partial [Pseudomonadota bacterium]
MVNSGAVPQDRAQPAAAAFIGLLPALLFALVGARCAEWASSWPAGLALQDSLRFGAASALTDLLAFGRYLPLLWLALLPGLLCRGSRGQIITSSLVVGLLLLARGALSQYRITAGVTLGDDLFAYSWADIRQTTAETRPDPLLFLLLGALWVLVAAGVRRQLQRGTGYRGKTWAAGLLLACGVSWALAAAGWTGSLGDGSEHQRVLRQNSLASFVDSVAASATGKLHVQSPATTPASLQLLGRRVDDPAFPFLHVEHAPDVIGPLLDLPQDPPDVVVLIVEGLGRTFSGPGARLGSFTPHLDALGAEGLYWENFVAPQGRTFGVLPSLLGSMPFGEQGVLEMQPPAPRHDNLASLLGTLGHRSRFVCGFEGDFDHQRTYLQSSGFDQIIDRGRIATTAAIANSWGFDDDVVLQTALATRRAISQPGHFLDVIQTISMHTPFSVPDQPRWNARVDSRLAELGRTTQAARYAPHRAIYASIL